MDYTDLEEQKEMLTSLYSVIKNVSWVLRIVKDRELLEEYE